MARDDQLTVFATGNGDAILIEARGRRILTDINLKVNAEDELPDLAEDLWDACPDSYLDLFVLTHPDVDHVRGFGELFHVGPPSRHDRRARILVGEIWCSPYGANPNYVTDEAQPIIDEIRRRLRLVGTAEGELPGNRVRVRSADSDETSGQIEAGIRWEILGPTVEEAAIPKAPPGEPENTSNPSSLVIRWAIDVEGTSNLVLLGGDATAPVWERVLRDNEHTPGRLNWNILVSPHHTSRYALGCKDAEGVFRFWPNAVEALSQWMGTGWVVSSSKRVVDDDDDPPSPVAKRKYVEILEGHQERFLCTGDHNQGNPGNVVFFFTPRGPARTRRGSRSGTAAATAVTGGGSYG